MSRICLGCGVTLQNTSPSEEGYTSLASNNICERCFRLTNYGEYKVTKRDNNTYLNIYKKVTDEDLVVYVSSILNLNLDNLNKFKNVILVITKRDIMPKSINDNKLKNYILDRYKNITYLEIVSSNKNYNIDILYNKISEYKNKKIYFVGNTNSGKSTLINKLIKNYSDSELTITTSIYPSTTLDVINIKINDLDIIDTPGIINSGSVVNYIDNKTLKMITPKKEIKPITYQIKGRGSLIFEDLIRVNFDTIESSMTIYMASPVKITWVGENNPKLLDLNKKSFNLTDNKDIVIEDLGFIKFTNKVNLDVYCKKEINVYFRDNLI